MKRILSIFMTILIMSGTAFAVSGNGLIECRTDNYEKYESMLRDALMESGNKVVESVDTTKIIPYYWIRKDGVDVFMDYRQGFFADEFENDVFSFFCVSKENSKYIVEIGQKYDKETDSYVFAEVSDEDQPEFAFDDVNIEKLLKKQNISVIKDIRMSDISYLATDLFLYLNTDKGEYIILSRNLDKKVKGRSALKANTLYSADEFVDYCLDAIEIKKMSYEEYNPKNGAMVLVDDDFVEVTPMPRTTESPSPKPSEKPVISPQPTIEPNSTITPKQEVEKTLAVKSGEYIIISIDKEHIQFPDAQPFVDENNRTQIPVRAVAEMLDCTVDWNGEAKTVTITHKNGDTIRLTIDSNIMTVNGKSVQMDTAAIIKDERTYIPVRFVAEAMGLKVEWKQ